VAGGFRHRGGCREAYHRCLEATYRFLVPPGRRVLEIGCGRGDLLASLRPGYGVGIDFSGEMIRPGVRRHHHLHFQEAGAHELPPEETFDFIILSDLVNDLWDVQKVFEQLPRLSNGRTRVILNFYSRLWQLPLALASGLGWAQPHLPQNWLTTEDVANLLRL